MADHEHDHEHSHEHGEHDEHDHEHDDEQGPPGFDDVVHWLSEQSCVALEEEGEHASLVFLGFPDGRVRAQQFDATGQDDVGEAWNRVATWARGVGADAIYFVGEARRVDEDDPEAEEEDVLFFAALNAEGKEAAFETPFTRDEEGKVTVGETEPATDMAVHLNEFRELWGLPLVEVEHDGDGHGHDDHGHDHHGHDEPDDEPAPAA